MEASRATFWQRRAALTALRHNLACALGGFLPVSVGISATFACALLVARENGGTRGIFWASYGVCLLVAAVGSLWRARECFFTVGDALVRLEWHLGLHNRLSAAAAGVGEFPVAQAAPDGYAFYHLKIALPLLGAAALVCTAAWVPLPNHATAPLPAVPPVAWTQTAAWIDALQKTDALQPAALEDLRERVEQLRQQPAADWYGQSSLEAGDNLREQTAQSIESLQRDLRSALGGMEAAQQFTDGTPGAEINGVRGHFENALRGLELGNLPLDHELLDPLKAADLANLKTLSPAQLDELKRRLAAGAQVCQACLHPGEMEGRLASTAFAGTGTPGGKGGGTSSAPLALQEKPTDLGTTEKAAVSNDDLTHAMPGEILGVAKGEHSVDPTKYAGPSAGGSVASNGAGGEAVWRDDLTPKEREVLKNFFK